MSLVINGKKIEIPGLVTMSWLDGIPWIKEITDFNIRTRPVNLIVAHTHEGVNGDVKPGTGPNSTKDETLAKYQVTTKREVSWDFTADFNGDIIVQNDPVKKYAWQAGTSDSNDDSLGIEMIQELPSGDLYEGQLQKVVLLMDALTALLGIQRQIVWDTTRDQPFEGAIERLKGGGSDFIGVVGHRNITKNKPKGDPGNGIFYALKAAGYECFDLSKNEDKKTWKKRQADLGILPEDCDGLPGKKTLQALKNAGKKHGMWIHRPIDDLLVIP